MYLRSQLAGELDRVPAAPRWTVLIPFFNEADYLAATVASLAAQAEPFELILVDNGSTDGSAAVALGAARAHGLPARLLTEHRPGKIHALRTGLAACATPWLATCDADTAYPPHYLAAAGRLLAKPGCVVAGAYFVQPDGTPRAHAIEAARVLAAGLLLPRLCHAGGAGQCFGTAALRAAGGFDPDRWRYVLEDHEVIHRTADRGTMRYARDLWCTPSPRDRDRPSIRWTLVERLAYAATGSWAGDWFFYRFLAGRLARRRLVSTSMRETGAIEGRAVGPTHVMC